MKLGQNGISTSDLKRMNLQQTESKIQSQIGQVVGRSSISSTGTVVRLPIGVDTWVFHLFHQTTADEKLLKQNSVNN